MTASLWNRLGIAYHQQSLLGDALKCYEHAAKVSKGNGEAWNNMGTVYFQEHKLAKAIRTYKKAIGFNSQNATFYSNMGIAYLNDRHVPEALDAFRQAVRLDPEVFGQTGSVGTSSAGQVCDEPRNVFLHAGKIIRCHEQCRTMRLLSAQVPR